MENFDYKIKEKVDSFKYAKNPDESAMKKLFLKLETSRNKDYPVGNFNKTIKTKRISPVFYRYAASIVVLISVVYIVYWMNEINLSVPKASQLTQELPDGSTVELNADSRISYNKLFWPFHRKISFNGEGFFNVKKGNKFTVISDNGTTQVLGTSFNIYSRAQEYIVECFSGRVNVSYAGFTTENILTAGKGIKLDKDRNINIFNLDQVDRNDWRNGEFYFDNEYLNKVFEELSRQFDINIQLEENIEHLKYSGYFNNKELEIALKMICEPLDLKYIIYNNIIEIKK